MQFTHRSCNCRQLLLVQLPFPSSFPVSRFLWYQRRASVTNKTLSTVFLHSILVVEDVIWRTIFNANIVCKVKLQFRRAAMRLILATASSTNASYLHFPKLLVVYHHDFHLTCSSCWHSAYLIRIRPQKRVPRKTTRRHYSLPSFDAVLTPKMDTAKGWT